MRSNTRTCTVRSVFSGAAFVFVLGLFASIHAGAEFYGTPPTGLFLLEEKHPCYLFVPASYSAEKSWPLLILLGERGDDPQEVIEPWVEWAKQNEFLVLAPSNLLNERENPEITDRWLLKMNRQTGERYRIDPARVLLIGVGAGAHYAAYLGLNYPEEFQAAALIGGAWAGPLESLMKPSKEDARRVPFYIALDPARADFSQVETKSVELEGRGYRITMERLRAQANRQGLPDQAASRRPSKLAQAELSALRERILQWFRDRSAENTPGPQPKKKLTQRIMKNLFED